MKTRTNIILSIFIALILSSCSNQGTSTGNPLVNLRYSTFSSSMSTLAVSAAKLCFKRVRFKQAGETTNPDPSLDADNIDFDIGEKTLSPTGGGLGNVYVSKGQYVRLEFDLDNHCGNGYSVSVTNSSGTFTTNDGVSIKFEGTLNIDGDISLELFIQNIVTELNAVTNSSQIKTRLESVSGSF